MSGNGDAGGGTFDRFARWLGANVNPGRMGAFTIGAVMCLHDAFQPTHSYIVVGFGVMLMSPSLADTVQSIVTGGRRNGNGRNGGGREGG